MKTQVCTQCGSKILPGDRFCTVCGAEIRQSASQVGSKRRRRTNRRSAAQAQGRKRRRKQRRRSLTPGIVALGSGILLLLAALLFVLKQGRTEPVATTLPDSHDEQGFPYPEVARITLEEAKTRYDAGTALFVDVRTQGEYETAHIPNAVSLPQADFAAGYQTLPRDAEIITYCT